MERINTRSVYIDFKNKGLLEKKFNINNRLLTAYIIPRTLVSEAKKFFEDNIINNRGIYYLIEEDENSPLQKIYVGQTINGIKRLDDHLKKKNYWGKAIMFLFDHNEDNDIDLNALETYALSKLIELRKYDVQKYDVQNKQITDNKMDYNKTDVIKKCYNLIKFLMISSGYSLESNQNNSSIFRTNRRGIIGLGIYTGNSFELIQGSEIDVNIRCNLDKYNQMREELINENILVKEGEKYILKKNLEFKTPSGASDFVLGGATNGWTEWKNNENKTLDEVYRKINN